MKTLEELQSLIGKKFTNKHTEIVIDHFTVTKNKVTITSCIGSFGGYSCNLKDFMSDWKEVVNHPPKGTPCECELVTPYGKNIFLRYSDGKGEYYKNKELTQHTVSYTSYKSIKPLYYEKCN